MTYQQFSFDDYVFDANTKTLSLHYSIDDTLHFTETYQFGFDFVQYDELLLDRAIQLLFFIAGVSYYKTYIPSTIVIKRGEVDQAFADFLGETYQKGLGEFFYLNHLDPRTPVTFPTTIDKLEPIARIGEPKGLLVGIGGGKDSLVSVEILRAQHEGIKTWSLNHRPQLTPLIERIGLPHAWVDRTWDKQLMELNEKGAYNGHVPISAIFAAMGAVVAVLTGTQDSIVSNEQSANEPTLHHQGLAINHQYSKSQAFEQIFQDQLARSCGDNVRYYSFLRPLSEVMIGRLFAEKAFEKYKDVFSSCNRAFVHTSDHMSWCGVCAKCAFIFLVLTPFLPRQDVEAIWNGKNLLLDPTLEPMYRKLLGIEGDKPFDCVGEIKEARAAMRLAFEQYPELAEKYQFEIPADYDYRNLGTHHMPQDLYNTLIAALPSSDVRPE
jgi:hypothetical protein